MEEALALAWSDWNPLLEFWPQIESESAAHRVRSKSRLIDTIQMFGLQAKVISRNPTLEKAYLFLIFN
jgi:hypothetical protein